MENGKLSVLIFLFSFTFASVKDEIIKFYKSYYPTIQILKIKSNKPFPKKYKTIKFLISPKTSSGTIQIDDKYYYIQIKAKIALFKAVRTIKQNEYILPNVSKEKVNFKYLYSTPLLKISPDLIAKNVISKGQIIYKNCVRIAPDVIRGEKVTVLLNNNGISIYTSGKALQDGNRGEIIKIRVNKKTLDGKVVKKGVVEIE